MSNIPSNTRLYNINYAWFSNDCFMNFARCALQNRTARRFGVVVFFERKKSWDQVFRQKGSTVLD